MNKTEYLGLTLMIILFASFLTYVGLTGIGVVGIVCSVWALLVWFAALTMVGNFYNE